MAEVEFEPRSVSLPGFPGGASGKEPACQCRRLKRYRYGFDPWVGKIPWRRAWQPTPVFLSGESHGQRSLAGCGPWGHKEQDMTEATEHAQARAVRLQGPFSSHRAVLLKLRHAHRAPGDLGQTSLLIQQIEALGLGLSPHFFSFLKKVFYYLF